MLLEMFLSMFQGCRGFFDVRYSRTAKTDLKVKLHFCLKNITSPTAALYQYSLIIKFESIFVSAAPSTLNVNLILPMLNLNLLGEP